MRPLRPAALSRTLALIPPAVALLVPHANAAFSDFIKIDGVVGESSDSKHVDWIDLSSFSFGVSNLPTLSPDGLKPGTSVATTFTFHKSLDKSSPAIFLACAQGLLFKSMILEVASTGGTSTVFYRITLSGVVISSLKTGTAAADTKPSEEVIVAYSQIRIEYSYQKPDGSFVPVAPVSWDFVNNKPAG